MTAFLILEPTMATMELRRLGDSGLEVSVICLGTMMFGDRTDAATAQRIIASALDAGVNFIDTADVYAKGASETIIGPAIAMHRRRWIVATKVGNVMTQPPHDGGLSRRWMLQACEDSLKRLGTDYIDIYYLHRDDLETPLAETIEAIGETSWNEEFLLLECAFFRVYVLGCNLLHFAEVEVIECLCFLPRKALPVPITSL